MAKKGHSSEGSRQLAHPGSSGDLLSLLPHSMEVIMREMPCGMLTH